MQELTGRGYEVLVDSQTRSLVLARFMDGNFISMSSDNPKTADLEVERRTLAPLQAVSRGLTAVEIVIDFEADLDFEFER